MESNSILSPHQAGFRLERSTLDQILYLSQSVWSGFNKPKLGPQTILATINFSKTFDSVWHPTLFTSVFRLASLFALHVGLSLSFLISALAWFIKTTKVFTFESVEVICKNPFLTLYFSLFSSMISLLLCHLSSAVFFMLTIWPFGPQSSVFAAVKATQGALIRLERWSEG